jgi:hypothetical protein
MARLVRAFLFAGSADLCWPADPNPQQAPESRPSRRGQSAPQKSLRIPPANFSDAPASRSEIPRRWPFAVRRPSRIASGLMLAVCNDAQAKITLKRSRVGFRLCRARQPPRLLAMGMMGTRRMIAARISIHAGTIMTGSDSTPQNQVPNHFLAGQFSPGGCHAQLRSERPL